MCFDFNSIEIPDNAAEEYNLKYLFAEFTDVFKAIADNEKYDDNVVEKKGYLWSDDNDPFYIIDISRYLNHLHPMRSHANVFKYNDKGVIIVKDINEEVDLSDFGELPIENMPFIVFQHHEGEMKGLSNGQKLTVPEDFQRENGFLNDTKLFKGVFKAIPVGSKYRLEKIWDRYYLNL